MKDKPASNPPKPSKPGREDRLKAALKANMGRRKAQARARSVEGTGGDNKVEEE